MRILLVNAPYFGGYEKMMLNLPPLGPAYVAAALQRAGHEVRILDLGLAGRRLPARLDGYDLVGISADTPRHTAALRLAARVRRSGVPVVMGGPHVSFRAAETLRTGVVDYVLAGEGEPGAVALAAALEAGGGLEEVPGLSWLRDGQVLSSGCPVPEVDVDSLPLPARSLLEMDRYPTRFFGRRGTSVVGSRGCPFRCAFCASSELFGRHWRPRDPESILDEVAEVHRRHGAGAIYFLDDNFTLDPDRTIRLCESMLRRGLDLHWWCFSRADTLAAREDLVEAMAAAGARTIFVGVETPSEAVLQGYGKRVGADTAARAVRNLRRRGIGTMAAFIIGGPGETRGMIERTIRFSRDLRPRTAQFSILTPYPGTRLFRDLEGRLLGRDWSRFDGLHATFRSGGVGPDELEGLLRKAYRSFYLRPSWILSHLSETRTLLSMPRMLRNGWRRDGAASAAAAG